MSPGEAQIVLDMHAAGRDVLCDAVTPARRVPVEAMQALQAPEDGIGEKL